MESSRGSTRADDSENRALEATLRSRMRRTLGFMASVPLRFVAPLFFDKKYLTGRFFEESMGGWAWVWRSLWTQKVLGRNRSARFPVSPYMVVAEPEGIEFHPDDLNNFQTFGCYFANRGGGRIIIGRGTYIAPNVGIITTNHNPLRPNEHLAPKDVVLGRNCWIGMNSVVLPGVRLGDHTVVGAGSVVTKSFADGYCLIAGSPAKLIRRFE